MSIKARLDKLEKKSSIIGKPPCILLLCVPEPDFTPEDIALLEADDEKWAQRVRAGEGPNPLVLCWSRERLEAIKKDKG